MLVTILIMVIMAFWADSPFWKMKEKVYEKNRLAKMYMMRSRKVAPSATLLLNDLMSIAGMSMNSMMIKGMYINTSPIQNISQYIRRLVPDTRSW